MKKLSEKELNVISSGNKNCVCTSSYILEINRKGPPAFSIDKYETETEDECKTSCCGTLLDKIIAIASSSILWSVWEFTNKAGQKSSAKCQLFN